MVVHRKKPTALEYFGYMLNFHSVLAGPYFMFADYQDFVEGTHYAKRALQTPVPAVGLFDFRYNLKSFFPFTFL